VSLPTTLYRYARPASFSPPAPFQKPAGNGRRKRLILRHRNRPVLPLQKQVLLGGGKAPAISQRPKCWRQRLVKTGGRLVKHARHYWLMLAEGHLTRTRFAAMLRRIALLPIPAN
jgi:hypothetical protein